MLLHSAMAYEGHCRGKLQLGEGEVIFQGEKVQEFPSLKSEIYEKKILDILRV